MTIDLISVPNHKINQEVVLINTELGPSWMDPIAEFLCHDKFPEDKKEYLKLRIKVAHFWISLIRDLYKRSYSGPCLLCIHLCLFEDVLFKIYEGKCRLHSMERSLAHQPLTQGYWWPKCTSTNEYNVSSSPFLFTNQLGT